MTSSFVPFAPAAKAPTGPPAAAPSFAPLVPASTPPALSIEPHVPAAPVLASNVPTPLLSPTHQESCAPKVNVLREADRITRIQIHCSCGETIELDCQY